MYFPQIRNYFFEVKKIFSISTDQRPTIIKVLLEFHDKGFATFQFMKSYRPSPSRAQHEMSLHAAQHHARSKIGKRVHNLAHQDDTGIKESQYISSRMLKRSSPYSSTILEPYTRNTLKVKAVELEGKRRRVDPITFHRKVDDAAGETGGEKYGRHSFYNRLSGYNDLDGAKLDTGSSEQNDSDDDASSVGSCSVNNMRADKFSNCCFAVPCQARELNSSDAESVCYSLDEEENRFYCSEENVEGHSRKHASCLAASKALKAMLAFILRLLPKLASSFCNLNILLAEGSYRFLSATTSLHRCGYFFNFCLSFAHIEVFFFFIMISRYKFVIINCFSLL